MAGFQFGSGFQSEVRSHFKTIRLWLDLSLMFAPSLKLGLSLSVAFILSLALSLRLSLRYFNFFKRGSCESETENAKTFQQAEFYVQKLSGQQFPTPAPPPPHPTITPHPVDYYEIRHITA